MVYMEQLSEKPLYTFALFSDVHIDEEKFGQTPSSWWPYSTLHWKTALDFAAALNVDFIVSAGDQVTNANPANLIHEWETFQTVFADSSYVNPIYCALGNHETRHESFAEQHRQSFRFSSGLNSCPETLKSGLSYYSFLEQKSGDLFLMMALEKGFNPPGQEQFSDAQLDWLETMLTDNYGKKNIFVVQHALVKGFGPGDLSSDPYYGGGLSCDFSGVKRFLNILSNYPDVIWISGHSHLDFCENLNYSNDNGKMCHMVHCGCVSNPTRFNQSSHKLDYVFDKNISQGYLVKVYKERIVFEPYNLCDSKLYEKQILYVPSAVFSEKRSFKKPDEDKVPVVLDKSNLDAKEFISSLAGRNLLEKAKSFLQQKKSFALYAQYQAVKKYVSLFSATANQSLWEQQLLNLLYDLFLMVQTFEQPMQKAFSCYK